MKKQEYCYSLFFFFISRREGERTKKKNLMNMYTCGKNKRLLSLTDINRRAEQDFEINTCRMRLVHVE